MSSKNQNLALKETERCYEKAEHRLRRPFIRPEVFFNLKGQAAGQAWLEKNQLRFNPVLLEENPQDFIQQTVPHEVAHLLCYQLFGNKVRPHGKQWQLIMTSLFQRPAEIYHQYDTKNSTQAKFLYRCQCPEQTLAIGVIRHNRIQKGAVYLCKRCHSRLFLLKPP